MAITFILIYSFLILPGLLTWNIDFLSLTKLSNSYLHCSMALAFHLEVGI